MVLKRPGNPEERALLSSMLEQGLTDRQIEAHFGGPVCVCDSKGRVCAWHLQTMIEPETPAERRERIRQERRDAWQARQARLARARHRED